MSSMESVEPSSRFTCGGSETKTRERFSADSPLMANHHPDYSRFCNEYPETIYPKIILPECDTYSNTQISLTEWNNYLNPAPSTTSSRIRIYVISDKVTWWIKSFDWWVFAHLPSLSVHFLLFRNLKHVSLSHNYGCLNSWVTKNLKFLLPYA